MNDFPDTNTAETIVFVGDGVIHNGRWQEWFPNANVHVLADTSDTTDRLTERLSTVLEIQPDVIVMLIGANDFGANRSVEYVVRSIEYFLAMVRQGVPGARTLVTSILPRGREYSTDIQNANRHLRQYSQNVYAQYLDLWPSLAMDDGELSPEFTNNRVNLTDAGYDALRAELEPALERLNDAPPMSRPISIIRDPSDA